MNVAGIGEVALIQRLIGMALEAGVAANAADGFPLLVGPGDDAAAWRTRPGVAVSTTDTVVEGVHFTRQTIPWRDLGWKVMAANLSDIAAMGGTPLYALVTLGLPRDTPVADVEELYHGMIESCQEYRFSIAGGDVVASAITFVSVTLSGLQEGDLLLRSQVKAGDLLAITGPLGSSQGGLEILTSERTATARGSLDQGAVDEAARKYLLQAHRRPIPRLGEGRILVEQGVRAAMDISDGLVEDVAKMMAASGLAARLDAWRVPIHPHLAHAFPEHALVMALSGGEDYHLLYAGPAAIVEATFLLIPGAAAIGVVIDGPPGLVQAVDKQGQDVPLARQGWDHFRS